MGKSKKIRSVKKGGMARTIILIVSVALALLGFVNLPLPDFFLQVLRLIAFAGFVILAYCPFTEKRWLWVAVYLAAGIFSQPLGGFILGQTIWTIIDIVLMVLIGFSIYKIVYPKVKS